MYKVCKCVWTRLENNAVHDFPYLMCLWISLQILNMSEYGLWLVNMFLKQQQIAPELPMYAYNDPKKIAYGTDDNGAFSSYYYFY